MNSSYTYALTPDSPTFIRPFRIIDYYYKAVSIRTEITGVYHFETASLVDTYGLLYSSPFDPSDPSSNLLLSDDDSGIDAQFAFSYTLEVEQLYDLVITTYSPKNVGDFTLLITGPSLVNVTRFSGNSDRTNLFGTMLNFLLSSLLQNQYSLTEPWTSH